MDSPKPTEPLGPASPETLARIAKAPPSGATPPKRGPLAILADVFIGRRD